MRKIMLFGGSFDPVHKGHLNAAQIACQEVGVEQLLVIPANVAPLKERALSPAKDRVNMLRIALKTIKGVKWTVSQYEIKKGGVSYTYDTVCHFKRTYKDAELFLLIGSDQLNQFDLWKNAHLFKDLCQVVCVKRTKQINIANVKRYGIRLLGNEPVETSSTDLRSRVDYEKITPGVSDYINNHLLYMEDRVKKWQSEKRWAHTVSVAKTIAAMANNNHLSAKTAKRAVIAAYYHDLAKDFLTKDLIGYAKKYIPALAGEDPEVLHAHVGADYVVRFYGMRDKGIVQAIANHTLPLSKRLTALDKLLYVADKVEPLRSYPQAKNNYKLAMQNYDSAFKKVFCEQFERFNKHPHDSSAPGYKLYVKLTGGK